MIGNTANLSKAMRAMLPLQINKYQKQDYHGGRPCRKLSVDSDAPRIINPVGTEAPPTISVILVMRYLRNWQCQESIGEGGCHQVHLASLSQGRCPRIAL
jgi:hypothetical protein